MEVEAVERQKLVSNDEETNELNEIVSHNASSQTTVQNKTPISPVLSENTSKNSSKINSETKFSYQNERRYDFKAAKKRIPKDDTESSSSSNNIIEFEPSSKCQSHLDEPQNGSCTSSTTLKVNNNVECSNPKLKTDSLNKNLSKSNLQSFEDRQLKHHSFISELPDVRHMEKALLKLLEDFHSGKLRAFGSGQCMDQMKKIREQQEQLARLHFDLGSEQMSYQEQTSEDKQKLLIEQLQQLSFSIEKLNSSTSDV